MLTRRIAASACALCLAIPTVATAKPVRYVGHLHHVVADVPAGDTKGDLPGTVAATPSTNESKLSADRGDGWLIAAVAEGGLLAAFAIGTAAFRVGRQPRASHMGV